MANSDFQAIVHPGKANGGNSRMVDVIDSDRLPWAFSPNLVFEHTVKWRDLRDATDVAQSDSFVVGGTIVAGPHVITFTDARTGTLLDTLTYQVHEDTITIGGTASDGNYDAIFVTPTIPVRARVVRDTTPADNDAIAAAMSDAIEDLIATELAGIVASVSATGAVVTIVYEAGIAAQLIDTAETTATGTIVASTSEDTDSVAAALEALIETARATTLAEHVADETVAASTITITYVDGVQVTMADTFPGTGTGTATTTNVATIPMGRTGDWFPAAVIVDGGMQNVVTAFAGGTPTITAQIGDADAVDGIMTATSIATAGPDETIAATEFAEHYEATFQPLVTITSNRLFTSLTAGEASFMVRYSAPPTI